MERKNSILRYSLDDIVNRKAVEFTGTMDDKGRVWTCTVIWNPIVPVQPFISLITESEGQVVMSENENKYSRKDGSTSESQLENAQEEQERVGAASTDPETTGPAENLRDKAAKAEDKSESSRDPV